MSVTQPAAKLPRSEQLAFLYEARAVNAVLEASQELGILQRLERGPVDPVTLAGECQIQEEAARVLLAALASLGIAEPDGRGGYLGVAGDVIGFIELLRRWEGLAQGLRRRPDPPVGAPPGADRSYQQTIRPLAALCYSAAQATVGHLLGARTVLDLGAGAAPYALALAAADPDCLFTAVDLPAVLPATRQIVANAGYEDRFRFIEDDVFSVDIEERAFDLVIIANLCHLFDASTNRRLLARAARWLRHGGTVAVIDFIPNERCDAPRSLALYAVDLVWRTPRGRVYPFSSYATWLREAAYERVERIELSSYPPVTLIRATRR
jgi:SAM-dependent methyltransferase